MNWLTYFKRSTLALIIVLISVNLWGQDPINLANCTIEGVDTYYHHTGSAYTITPVVKDGSTTVDPTYYNVSYTYNGAAYTGSIINKGLYVLTISGKESYSTGTITKAFSIYGELSGEGTEVNPWQIGSAADWEEFASHTDYWGGYVVMTNNVPNAAEVAAGITSVSTMIGTESEGFEGVFDGEYNSTVNTLTFSGNEMYGVAPFFDTYGATIKNLKVEGNIVVNAGWAAGLIYMNYGETNVENVTISVIITDGNNGSAGSYCGGFAVQNLMYEEEECVLNFSNCVYNGKMMAETNSGGFCANYNQGSITFTDCVFAPAEGSAIESGYTFGLGTVGSDCYYTNNLGTTEQGEKAYLISVPSGNIGKFEKQIQGFNVYKDVAVVHNVKDAYAYTGSAITITPEVSFDGVDALANEYCTAAISLSPVQAVGTYTFTITPDNDKGYYGSYTKSFDVVKLNGTGEENDPYIIANTADWNCLTVYVNDNGESFSGKYFKLTDDITVSTMVGTPEHPFSGDFSGATGVDNGIYTLTFNYGTSGSPTEEEIVAPFRYTDGATITYLRVDGDIYTNVGKEAGLIGVNTITSDNTHVTRVIVEVGLHCGEDLWDAEGGGFAYIGKGITFNSCAYRGYISANNYMGGFCGNADDSTDFTNCLFNPNENGVYWAENFVYNMTGSIADEYYESCYFTLGHNQEDSEQGILVYVGSVPNEAIGKKLTELYGVVIYTPILVTISDVNDIYIYDENVTYTITPTVKFNETTVTNNTEYTYTISPTTVHDKGSYTLTVTGKTVDESNIYVGRVTKSFDVVEGSSSDWYELQELLSGDDEEIKLSKNYVAGANDAALSIPASRTVTIYLNGHTIDRHLTDAGYTAGGQVLRISANANVTIIGRGFITGGRNKASNNNEHGAYNDGGAIYNMGNLTLIGYYDNNSPDLIDSEYVYDTIFIYGNKCVKNNYPNAPGTYRTARGGAIYSGIGSTLTIHGCVIRDNNAQGGGGGVFADKAVLTIDHNTVIRSNTSLDKGGGIRVDANGVEAANITDCKISSNTVEFNSDLSVSNGGGVHFDGGTLNLTNCIINNNNSSKYGGGIYQMGGTLNATNCTISYNKSYDENNRFEGYGGGVCVLGGTFMMDGGTITGNSSYIESGGGVFVATGKSFKIKGAVNITGNWKYNNASLSESVTNVYLKGSTDKINIIASIEGAYLGVSKNGTTGQFTTNLQGKGTVANFASDNANYQILPITVNSKQEAKIGTPATWDDPTPVNNIITITEPTYINTTVTESYEYTIVFTGDGCLIIGPNGVLTAKIDNDDPLKLIIEDGGQVITNTTVAARVKKEVKEFSSTAPIDNWYLISSPVNNPAITTATNIVNENPNIVGRPGYDLYRFNEAATAYDAEGDLLHWENYRNEAYHGESPTYPFDNMTNGRGYLYRSCQDYTVIIDGNLNVGEVTSYILTNSSTDVLKGFNVIGNPYPHNIKKGEGQSIPNTYLEDKYYVLNPEGCVWTLKTDAEEIPPFTGILVQAKSEVSATQTLTISDVVASAAKGGIEGNNNIWFTVANSKYEDKVCVEFKQGHGLNKIAHINEEAPMLYVNYNGEDFASVDMNPEARYFNLNFEAKTTGMYTLSVQPQGDYSYLHLYDKLTGKDVDLLLDNEYSFVGSTTDAADRFTIVLNPSTSADSENEIFAYQSGNEIIVNGKGELQIFDVMGRMVATKHVNGVQAIEKPSTTGVYIMRLNGMTQKIVIK